MLRQPFQDPFMSKKTEQEIRSLIERARKSSERRNWLIRLFVVPDHHHSAELYKEAGHKLKFLNRNQEAAECYTKAGDEYLLSKCTGDAFFAADAYMSSYTLSKDRDILIKACNLYCMNDSYNLAATARKSILESERDEQALESLNFIIVCYEKANMHMNKLCHVEKKGIVCIKLERYREAGDCFKACDKALLAFLAYFLAGDERKMKELDFEDDVIMAFYGGNRVKDATEAISKYEMNHGIRAEHRILFSKALERLKPEYDIL